MTATRALLVTWLLALALAGNLGAAEHVPEMRDVEIKVILLDVDEVNNVSQSFAANLALAIRWHDRSLAHVGAELNQQASGGRMAPQHPNPQPATDRGDVSQSG